jgi:hypothetical protein
MSTPTPYRPYQSSYTTRRIKSKRSISGTSGAARATLSVDTAFMPLPTGYADLVQHASAEAREGATETAVLRRLRDGGLQLLPSARALCDIYDIDLGEAQRRIDASGVWSDVRDDRAPFGVTAA